MSNGFFGEDLRENTSARNMLDFSKPPHPLATQGELRVRQGLANVFNEVFSKGFERGDFDYEMEEEWSGIIDDYPDLLE